MSPSRPARAALVLLLPLVLAATGCQGGPRPAAEFVRQAEVLHESALGAAVVRNPDVETYIDLVGKRIVAAAAAVDPNNTRDPTLANLRFHLVANDVANAYGTGGGHVYVYSGLLQLCESEEELAALMAVQYAHALSLDVQRTGMRPDVAGGTDPLAAARVVLLFVNAPFPAAWSLAADRRAFDVYARGGWDPAKFAEAYERLRIRGYELPPAAGGDGRPRPSLDARAAAARGLRATLPAEAREWRADTVADTAGFRDVKARAAEAARQLRDAPAQRAGLYLAAFPNVVLPADLPPQVQAQAQIRRELTPVAPVTPRIEAN
jgi:hypothetical protein